MPHKREKQDEYFRTTSNGASTSASEAVPVPAKATLASAGKSTTSSVSTSSSVLPPNLQNCKEENTSNLELMKTDLGCNLSSIPPDGVVKVYETKKNINSLDNKYTHKKETKESSSRLFTTNERLNDNSLENNFRTNKLERDDWSFSEMIAGDKKNIEVKSSKSSDSTEEENSMESIESQLNTDTCDASIDSVKKIEKASMLKNNSVKQSDKVSVLKDSSIKKLDKVSVLKNKFFKLYGRRPVGGYANKIWWLEMKINEMESMSEKEAHKTKGESTTSKNSILGELTRVGNEAETRGDQTVGFIHHHDETNRKSLAGKLDNSQTSAFPDVTISAFPDVTIQSDVQLHMLAKNKKREIRSLKKQYLEIFGVKAKGAHQNNIEWLKSSLNNLNPNIVKEINELREKYYNMYGRRPRGSRASEVAWLESKILEGESLEEGHMKDKKRIKPILTVQNTAPVYGVNSEKQKPKKRKRVSNSDGVQKQSSSIVTAKDVTDCIIAAQSAMKKSPTDPCIMENLLKAAELIAKRQYPELMMSPGEDETVEKVSLKGTVTVKCPNCKQSNKVKFKFNS